MVKQLIKQVVGDRNIGRIQYLLMPRLGNSLGGPMNGQAYRRQMLAGILECMPFSAIVETGTFRGSTTAFFGTFDLPVYSVEVNARHAGFASLRLYRQRDRIHLFQGDSPQFLKNLATDSRFPKSKVFFYLDAHWYRDLPLGEELEIIFSNWTDAVVMVDDFQVPGTEYAYDDYGPGKALTMEYLERLKHFNLTALFPAADANLETGLKRGCVVLAREKDAVEALKSVETLASRGLGRL